MRRALFGLVVALGFLLTPTGSAELSYSDPAGDAGTAPDITRVTVSDVAEVITFDVAVRLVPGSALLAALDTDRNLGTGVSGFNWAAAVVVSADGSTESIALLVNP